MSDSSIERLQKKINQRNQSKPELRRGVLHEKQTGPVAEDWEHDHEDMTQRKTQTKHHHTARNFFIGALAFFGISVLIALLVIFRGANVVQPPVLNVTGPAAVDAGEILNLEIRVANENTAPLRNVDILVDYPRGTRDPADNEIEQTRLRIPLGDIASGSRVTESARAVLYGAEGAVQDIIITVEYRIDGSNAVFTTENRYTVQIGDTPLLMQIEAPTEVISGEEITMTFEVIANTSEPAQSVLARIDFPFGFSLRTADPEPLSGTTVWDVGALATGESFPIVVTGTLEGQDGEERTFDVTGGVAEAGDRATIGSELFATQHTIQITRPFVSAEIELNNTTEGTVPVINTKIVNGKINWANTLPEPVSDVKIVAEFSGNALDEDEIDEGRGFYNSVNNTLTWDQSNNDELRLVDAGTMGTYRFSFIPRDIVRAGIQNGSMVIDLTITGVRAQTGAPVTFTDQRIVRIASESVVSAAASITDGPDPAEVEIPSTLQIELAANTATNDIRNARVTARVPSYVTWIGSDSVEFNAIRREIEWNIGTLVAGTGYTAPPLVASMAVEFIPSVSQFDAEPPLLTDITLSGVDAFTDTTVTVGARDLELPDRVVN